MTADYSDIHERSLFQLGDWHIVRSGFFLGGTGDFACFAVHTGCEYNHWDNGLIRAMNNQCFRCGDGVPDELQALITLYHWKT